MKVELRRVEVVVRVRPSIEQVNKIIDTAQNFETTSEYSDSKKCRVHQSSNASTACVTIDNISHAIHLCDVGQEYFVPHRKTYLPDQVFDPSCTNEDLFNELVLPKLKVLVEPVSNSIECHTRSLERQTWEYYAQSAKIEADLSHDTLCFLAYGHTNSGKTHSIVGENDNGDDGLLTRTVMYMLNECTNARVRVAMLEIYMERVYDLLANGVERRVRRVAQLGSQINGQNDNFIEKDKNGSAHNTSSLRVIVEGLSTITISSLQQWKAVSAFGMHSRRTTTTERNERSSRSHALFIVQSLESNMRVCFVDLAGSERQNSFSAQLNKESIFINKSLSQLSTVLRALSSQRVFANDKRSYVNFRGSTLTVLLERYLRGVSRTTFLACIHPSPSFYKETLNTLRYSHRLKLIRTVKLCNMHVANKKEVKLHWATRKSSRHGMDINSISIGDKNNFNSDDDKNYNENSFYTEYAKYNIANVESSIFYEDTSKQKDCDAGIYNSILPTIIELTKVHKEVNEHCRKERHYNNNNKTNELTSDQKQTSTCENFDNKQERIPSLIRPFREVETASSAHNSLMEKDNEVDVYPFVKRSSNEFAHVSSAQTQENEISHFNINFDDRFDNVLPSSLQVIGYVTNKLINTPTQMFTHSENIPEFNCNGYNTNCRSNINKGNNITNKNFNNENNNNNNHNNKNFNTEEGQFIDTVLENKIFNREHTLNDDINPYSKEENKDHHAREFAILPVQDAFDSLTLLTTGIKSSVSLCSSVSCIMEPTCVYEENCEKIKVPAERIYNLLKEKSYEQFDVDNKIDGNSDVCGNTDEIVIKIDDSTKEEEQVQKMYNQCRNTNNLNHVQNTETTSCKYQDEQENMPSQSNNREFKVTEGQKEKEVCSECVFALALFDRKFNNIDNNNHNNHETYTETSNRCNHMSSTRVDKCNCTRRGYMINDTIFPFAIVFAVSSNSSMKVKEYVLEWLISLGSENFCNKATQIKDVSSSITSTCAAECAAATNTIADCINVKTPYDEHERERINVAKGNGYLTKRLVHTGRLTEFEVNTYGNENCKFDIVSNGEHKLESSVSESTLSDKKEAVFNNFKNSEESVDTKEEHKAEENVEEKRCIEEWKQRENMLNVNFFHDNSKEYRETLELLVHGREQESNNDMYKRFKEACTVTDLPIGQENHKTANMQVESFESQLSENMRENDHIEFVNLEANVNEMHIAFRAVKPIINIDQDKAHNGNNNKTENIPRKSEVESELEEKELLYKCEQKEEETRCTAEKRKRVEEFTCFSNERNKNQNNKDEMKLCKTNASEYINGDNYNNEGKKIEEKEESRSINVHKRRTKRRKYVTAMAEINHSWNYQNSNDLQEIQFRSYEHKPSNDEKKKGGDENAEVIARSTIASSMGITPMEQSSVNLMKAQEYRETVTQFNQMAFNNIQESSNNVVKEQSKLSKGNTYVKISNITNMKHPEKFISGEENSNTLTPSEHKAKSNLHRKEVLFERCQACTLC